MPVGATAKIQTKNITISCFFRHLPNKRSRLVLVIFKSLNMITIRIGATRAIKNVVTKKTAYADFMSMFPWSTEYVKQSAKAEKTAAITVATSITGISILNNSLVFFICEPFRVSPPCFRTAGEKSKGG